MKVKDVYDLSKYNKPNPIKIIENIVRVVLPATLIFFREISL